MLAFNAISQQDEEVTWTSDSTGELICTYADGHFLKFPAGLTQAEVVTLLEKHKEQNDGNEVITPEMEAAKQAELQASQDLASELNGNPPKGSQNATITASQDQPAV